MRPSRTPYRAFDCLRGDARVYFFKFLKIGRAIFGAKRTSRGVCTRCGGGYSAVVGDSGGDWRGLRAFTFRGTLPCALFGICPARGVVLLVYAFVYAQKTLSIASFVGRDYHTAYRRKLAIFFRRQGCGMDGHFRRHRGGNLRNGVCACVPCAWRVRV